MIKLFASDLDGSLLNIRHEVDDQVNRAIKTVNEAGLAFSIATGRSMHGNEAEQMGFEGTYYQISMNGALLRDCNGKVLYSQPINHDVAMELIRTFKDYRLEIVGMDHMYVMWDEEKFHRDFLERATWGLDQIEEGYQRFIRLAKFNTTLEELEQIEILKINTRFDGEITDQLEIFLNEHKDSLINSSSAPHLQEITAAEVDKKTAILALAKELNISEDEVAVYGDNGNDLQMLAHFKHSYTPSDAIDSAKKTAHQVIGSCAEYGVSRHIIETIKNQK